MNNSYISNNYKNLNNNNNNVFLLYIVKSLICEEF